MSGIKQYNKEEYKQHLEDVGVEKDEIKEIADNVFSKKR